MSGQSKYQSFQEFWPFYLREHAHPLSRAMHYIGTTGVMAIVVAAFASGNLVWLWLMPLCGYGFAWAAHFFVEKNKPATFFACKVRASKLSVSTPPIVTSAVRYPSDPTGLIFHA